MIKKDEIPEYYIGKKHKIEARKVIEDFQGDNYNLGTAITYLLRAGKKEGNPIEQDIRKAINHLHFELDRVYKGSNTKAGGLDRTGVA
tara:strand:+ start:5261 stop:5524 length:264 start_codon:yes stop_codon:yes gene_type:complete